MIPWKEVSAAIGKIFALSTETQKNKADIKQTREELEKLEQKVQRLNQQIIDLTFALQRAYFETQRLRDESERRDKDATREREILLLRLENQRLRFESGLPPARADAPEE